MRRSEVGSQKTQVELGVAPQGMRTVGLTCHDPGGAVTAGALGVH